MARILIVDDEAPVRRTLRLMLERAGHEVFEAEDGGEAQRKLARCSPDLLVLDLLMPKREGIETIIGLRRSGDATPILAISGGGRIGKMAFLDAALVLGATRTLTKPMRARELTSAVDACLAAAAA